MSEVSELRQRLRQKEVTSKATLARESEVFDGHVTSFLKKLGIILSVLIVGFTIAKLFSNAKKKSKTAAMSSEPINIHSESRGYSIPVAIRQKLITMLIQIGLTILTSKVKAKLENGLDHESSTNP